MHELMVRDDVVVSTISACMSLAGLQHISSCMSTAENWFDLFDLFDLFEI